MAISTNQIKRCIEQKLETGFKKFVIFPFGEVGLQVRDVLRNAYGIEAEYVLDNHLCKYNPAIKPLEFLDTVSRNGLCAVLAVTNLDIYGDCKKALQRYFADEAIAEFPMMVGTDKMPKWHTEIGKHSYGPLCRNHDLIESIGAFSSFAVGVEVVAEHSIEYLTTYPMIYAGANYEDFVEFSCYKSEPWYFDGVTPRRDKVKTFKRIRIGSDVWLGRNVIITKYSNIGNGVVAGAGSVITKDVPDYAVVAGVPARIIRFRYSPEEIKSLNQIAWWDWTDDEIRERYDDFYLPVSEFIKKYLK